MAREISAGGVVVRHMRGRWYVAVIEPAGRGQDQESRGKAASKTASKPVRALPKGLVEDEESAQETARREVREETGLEADVVTKLGDIKYFYVRSWGDRERVFKIVSFYLFRYRSGTLGDISNEMLKEVASAEWVSLEEADRTLSYRTERQMVGKAREWLEKHPEFSPQINADEQG